MPLHKLISTKQEQKSVYNIWYNDWNKFPFRQSVIKGNNKITELVIKRAHIATGHGARDRMLKELGKKYANVTRDSIELFKSMCIDCQRKRVRPMTKGVVVRPNLSKEFSARSQVDLIVARFTMHYN
jgi:hypothetical protein